MCHLNTRIDHLVIGTLHQSVQIAILEAGHIVGRAAAASQTDIVDLRKRRTCHLVKPIGRRSVILCTWYAFLHTLTVFRRIHEGQFFHDLLGGDIGIYIYLRRHLAIGILGSN